MRFEVEGRLPVENVKAFQVSSTLKALRSYGPASYASLTDESGNYLQVAGGGVTCMIERRDVAANRHFRAYQDRRIPVFADGTILAFSGGEIKLMADEWFTSADAEEVFLAFLSEQPTPSHVKWRDISDILQVATVE